MKSIRALGVAVAALLLGASFATPAFAHGNHHHPHYPPVFNGISASPHEVCTGGRVNFKVQTFKANVEVHYWDRVNGTVVASGNTSANSAGKVFQQIQMTVKGQNKVTFSGPGKTVNTLTLSTTIKVERCHHHHGPRTQPTTQSPAPAVVVSSGGNGTGLGGLLRTGAFIGSGLALLVAFIAGVMLLLTGMRRRNSQQPVT